MLVRGGDGGGRSWAPGCARQGAAQRELMGSCCHPSVSPATRTLGLTWQVGVAPYVMSELNRQNPAAASIHETAALAGVL